MSQGESPVNSLVRSALKLMKGQELIPANDEDGNDVESVESRVAEERAPYRLRAATWTSAELAISSQDIPATAFQTPALHQSPPEADVVLDAIDPDLDTLRSRSPHTPVQRARIACNTCRSTFLSPTGCPGC